MDSTSPSGALLRYTVADFVVFPLVFYLVWQIGYLILTEYILAHKFTEDPQLITALR